MKNRIVVSAVFLMIAALVTHAPSAFAQAEKGDDVAVVLKDEADVTLIPSVSEVSTDLEGAITEEGEMKISIDLEDVQIEEVVKLFTHMVPEANIVFKPGDTNLQGAVSVRLKDVPWDAALNSILAQKGLTLHDPEGIGVYSIKHKPKDAPEPLIVKTLFLKYATVREISAAITASLNPRGRITGFPSRNALIVQTTKANMAETELMITQIDIPRKQVFIEAKFMELNDRAIKDLGVNWQMLQAYEVGGSKTLLNQSETFTSSSGRKDEMKEKDEREAEGGVPTRGYRTATGPLYRDLTVETALNQAASRTFSDSRTAVLSPLTFNVLLSALKQQSGVSVVSNPRILVANSEPAVIHIGETRTPLIPETTMGDQGVVQTVYAPGAPIESGVMLNVTPTVNTESNITVEISPEITRVLSESEWSVAPDGSKYPATSTKKIRTIFTLLSGQTVAIGGLTETMEDDQQSRIPLLGDIPLIGKYFFGGSHRSKSQKETIIFVTVGLAVPETMGRDIGMPGDAMIVHRNSIAKDEAKQNFDYEMEKLKADSKVRQDRAEQRKRRLLRRTR